MTPENTLITEDLVVGTGEEATFSQKQLDRLLQLGKKGIEVITKQQRKSLGTAWPLP